MDLLPPEELSKALKKKRSKLGYTQQRIAKLTGISNSQVSRLEKNDVNYTYKVAYNLWNTLEKLEKKEKSTAEDLMSSPVNWVKAEDTLLEAKEKMLENDFTQLPVKKREKQVGMIDDRTLMEVQDSEIKVKEVMKDGFNEVKPSTSESSVKQLLRDEKAVLVKDSVYRGIITRSDVM